MALTALSAADNNGATNNGGLVVNVNDQTITVANHFTGTNAQTGIERINFTGATSEGYCSASRTTSSAGPIRVTATAAASISPRRRPTTSSPARTAPTMTSPAAAATT